MIYIKRVANADVTRQIDLNKETANNFFNFYEGDSDLNLIFEEEEDPTNSYKGIAKKTGNSYTITGEIFSIVRQNCEPDDILIFSSTSNLNKYKFKIVKKEEENYSSYDKALELLGSKNSRINRTTHLLTALEDSSSSLPRTFSASSSTPFINTLLTAIKTKPFVLLAGISGTGKSRIVRELARACWPIESEERKAQSPKNFKMIQVRPNWHDSSDILGYVSRISGEEFVIGDFLRAIAEAWQNTSIPYFVCLDEMNLAPVEQYFAEYLSVFESRKFDDDKECFVTDNIISPIFENKEGNKEVKEYYKNLVKDLLNDCPTNKVFALNNQFLEEGISIPPNLIVIGTVNMDETTYSFSRKVLDRAMTIEMNEVNLEAGIGDNSNENDFSNIILSQGDILPKAKSLDVLINENPKISADVVEYLKNINTILDKTSFKIAFRTRNEAIIYVLNMLELRKEEDQDLVMQDALDDITMMKILSRIEGDESKIKKEQLISLQNEVGQKSKEKLSYMIQRLASGFTSFWE